MKRPPRHQRTLPLVGLALCAACSSNSELPPVGTQGADASFNLAANDAGDASVRPFIGLDASVGAIEAGSKEAALCKTEQVGATMVPTRLAFIFDVSGSMGKGDEPWYDKTLKWDPVVAATKGFFADQSSQGIEASLIFFPAVDDPSKCLASTYVTPNVPMTALPSAAFGAAIDAQAPMGNGTPTGAALEGTLTYIRAQAAAKPAKYVIVLATDGEPADCTTANNIAYATRIVSAARAEGVSTYVIGVRNPPIANAPDVTSNLLQIASAGGTTIFFLDTGTPSATQEALTATINQIRGASMVCDVAIPAPPSGRTFERKNVLVTYGGGALATTTLSYDATCAGANAWRYDDPTNPTRVVLCPSTCSTIQSTPGATLSVGFACEEVITTIL